MSDHWGGETVTLAPVAVVGSPRVELLDDDWGDVISTITLLAPFGASSILGLEAFSHLEVVFLFDRVPTDRELAQSRVPRGNPAWPEVGIFAQRAKDRPNRIGLSRCELLQVDDVVLTVRGLDAIDGTPILDLKPYLVELGPRGTIHQPQWAIELMSGYF